ncbi:MAG: hypothetical protein ACJ8R9_20025 [Steroidobacteraceae bacterium]
MNKRWLQNYVRCLVGEEYSERLGAQLSRNGGLEHRQLAPVRAIGVDEILYGQGHHYLTLVGYGMEGKVIEEPIVKVDPVEMGGIVFSDVPIHRDGHDDAFRARQAGRTRNAGIHRC